MSPALETRLARAASEGDLATLLAALEGADWALPLAGEAALFAALAEIVGGGMFRFDPRLPFPERAAREADFDVGAFDADWREATVLIPEPDDRDQRRARKADARLVADATFAPGGGALGRGATFVVYRDAGALAGHADLPFAVLLGTGDAPTVGARPADPLAAALVRRALPSLAARLERQTRSARALVERLGDRAQVVSGAALYVTGDVPSTALFDASAPLGGVVSARRAVPGGALLTAGLEHLDDLWHDLTGDAAAPEATAADEPGGEGLTPDLLSDDEQASAPVDAATPAEAEDEALPPEPEGPLMPDLPEVPEVRGSAASEGADLTEGLSDMQRAAFERLREWRNAEARRQEVSRFIIASNATLAELVRRAPQTEAELREVRGMGPERVRKYAHPLLTMLRGVEPS